MIHGCTLARGRALTLDLVPTDRRQRRRQTHSTCGEPASSWAVRTTSRESSGGAEIRRRGSRGRATVVLGVDIERRAGAVPGRALARDPQRPADGPTGGSRCSPVASTRSPTRVCGRSPASTSRPSSRGRRCAPSCRVGRGRSAGGQRAAALAGDLAAGGLSCLLLTAREPLNIVHWVLPGKFVPCCTRAAARLAAALAAPATTPAPQARAGLVACSRDAGRVAWVGAFG